MPRSIYTKCANNDWYQVGKKRHCNANNPTFNPTFIDNDGNQYWYRSGVLHRGNDLPAAIYANGDQLWYHHGKLHREGDLPASIRVNGDQHWYQNGKLHRNNDLPAFISVDDGQYWYRHGKLYRGNDLPARIDVDGNQWWYQNETRHRDNTTSPPLFAPMATNGGTGTTNCIATTTSPPRRRYQNGKLHRDNDLPAVICADGSQYWYQYNKILTSDQMTEVYRRQRGQKYRVICVMNNARARGVQMKYLPRDMVHIIIRFVGLIHA